MVTLEMLTEYFAAKIADRIVNDDASAAHYLALTMPLLDIYLDDLFALRSQGFEQWVADLYDGLTTT